ncbi:protein neprosin-like [Aristolochia californica]|uniref:protein neprosin-like n=1 Tax=Aristolochia californica TaxID=171875 RepID=UPI0035D6881D
MFVHFWAGICIFIRQTIELRARAFSINRPKRNTDCSVRKLVGYQKRDHMLRPMAASVNVNGFFIVTLVWILASLVHCQDTSPSVEEYVEMKEYLATVNKPGVKTFTTEHGDTFDCVEIRKQPAFDNPLLKDHEIQLQPTSPPLGMKNKSSSYIAMKVGLPDEGCPAGTVPIRRVRMKELFRAGSVANYRSKYGRAGKNPLSQPGFIHQHAVLRLDTGGPYYGTEVGLNVWNPKVNEANGESFSLAQLWVVNTTNPVNTIEAGWHVMPQIYNDAETHLFIYSTANGYQTGCYNLGCGFVQVDPKISPGLSFTQVSSPGGTQVEVKLSITRDANNGNWWLGFEEVYTSNFVWVGYWPANLFNTLNNGADSINWGGEVCIKTFPGTSYPAMGSGAWAYEEYGKAAYANNIKIVNSNNVLVDAPDNLVSQETLSSCFKVTDKGNNGAYFGRYFYFGGPGGQCPSP